MTDHEQLAAYRAMQKAVQEEFEETRDAVLDADPVQWSRINGFEAGHVTRIRPTAQ